MNQKNLKIIIDKLIKEYTGTGASGGNAGDGNIITSPRPYHSDSREREAYMKKNVYGGEGGHYRRDSDFNYNAPAAQSSGGPRFEGLDDDLEEDAYGHATLTSQGGQALRGPGVWEEDEEELEEQVDGQDVMGGTMGTGQGNVGGGIGGAGGGTGGTGGAGGGAGGDPYAKDLEDIDKENLKDQNRINKRNLNKFDIQIKQAQHKAGLASQGATKALADLDSQITSLSADEKETKGEYLTLDLAYRELNKKSWFDLTDEDKKNKKEWYKQLVSLRKKLDGIETKRDELIQSKNKTKVGTPGSGNIIGNLRKQKAQMKKQIAKQAQMVAESLYKDYAKSRKNKSLKEFMASHKRGVLYEQAMSKFFKLFDEGKTDEEVLRIYAEQGIVVPEPFVKKARDKYKKLQHEKLDLDELEQETKEFKSSKLYPSII